MAWDTRRLQRQPSSSAWAYVSTHYDTGGKQKTQPNCISLVHPELYEEHGAISTHNATREDSGTLIGHDGLKGYSSSQVALDIPPWCWRRVLKVDESKLSIMILSSIVYPVRRIFVKCISGSSCLCKSKNIWGLSYCLCTIYYITQRGYESHASSSTAEPPTFCIVTILQLNFKHLNFLSI